MEAPWYYLLIYVVIGSLILWFFDKKQIIKSKRLRYFIVIIVYTLICWGVYDLITGQAMVGWPSEHWEMAPTGRDVSEDTKVMQANFPVDLYHCQYGFEV